MKTLTLLLFFLTGMQVFAQEKSPIPLISQQIIEYSNFYPREKVFLTVDKTHYKPGETIWFSAYIANENSQAGSIDNSQLFVKLFDKKGNPLVHEIFRKNNSLISGDILIPEDIPADQYFLVAYTSMQYSPEDISCTTLKIDPEYNNQWVAETVLKDSISTSGQKNELYVILREISGDIKKNTSFRYQLLNGTEVIGKDKLKTDVNGKATIAFTIPAKTNGEPFTCLLTDVQNEWKQEVFLPTNIDPLIIKFFPEGGNLIAGIPTKIGFTAFNKWGLPVNIEGSLINQDGKTISQVKTFTKGLGLFPVNNDGNQKLKLVISGKTGSGQSFLIPAPDSNGLSLSIVKTDVDFISANLIFADKQKHSISLMATQDYKLVWAADMEIDGLGRIKIPVENLPPGINLLSVFSNTGTLMAERIVFLDKQNDLKIEVLPAQKSLQTSEKMKVKVRLTDENNQPLSGLVTISVTDIMRQEYPKPQINKYISVSSDLETPFSLISEALKEGTSSSALLDVFLVSNRIKSFRWDKIRQFKPGSTQDPNAGNNGISGEVTDKTGNKVNKAKVSLVSNKNMQLLTTTTNDEGVFSFPDLNKTNRDDFSAKATDQEGKRELNITFYKNMEGQISDYIINLALKCELTDKEQVADKNYIDNNQMLFTVAPKKVKSNSLALENQRKLLSGSTNLLDVIKTVKPFRLMNNQIVFFGSENSLNFQGGALIVIDGQQMGTDVSALSNLSTTEIDHFTVSTNPMDIQRYTGLNSVGLVEIFLKNAKTANPDILNENQNKYDGMYRIPNAFEKETTNPKRDIRTTLLWIPNQKVDEYGEFEFPITAGKVISDFVIDVQGISVDGRLGSASASFSVTK